MPATESLTRSRFVPTSPAVQTRRRPAKTPEEPFGGNGPIRENLLTARVR